MKKSRPKIFGDFNGYARKHRLSAKPKFSAHFFRLHTRHTHTQRSRDLWFLRFAHPGDERNRVCAGEGAAPRRKVGSKGEKNARERVC